MLLCKTIRACCVHGVTLRNVPMWMWPSWLVSLCRWSTRSTAISCLRPCSQKLFCTSRKSTKCFKRHMSCRHLWVFKTYWLLTNDKWTAGCVEINMLTLWQVQRFHTDDQMISHLAAKCVATYISYQLHTSVRVEVVCAWYDRGFHWYLYHHIILYYIVLVVAIS